MNFRSYFTLFILLILTQSFSYAENLLSGKIVDIHGAPISGAIIEITDLKTGAASDSGGHYLIANLPKGSFTVEVHFLGYATNTQIVAINGETKKDFVLNDNIIEKNEVVVTGSSLATSERKSITPIQSINLRQMHENAFTNVIDALTSLPGVSALSTGPAISKPVIRGLGYNRIITLNDGVRQEGQQWGDEHGIEIDDYNVTRVEVLKGPASLAYGSDALAGVINIISNPQVPDGKIIGNVIMNYQTNNGLAAVHADLAGKKNGLSWDAYVTQKNAHDYHNAYDGYVFDTRFQNTNYGASVGVNKSWGSSKLSFTAFDQKLGISDGTRDSLTGQFLKPVTGTSYTGADSTIIATRADNRSYAMTVPYQNIQHYKLVWDNSLYLNNGGRLAATFGVQQNTRKEFGDPNNSTTPGLSLLLQTVTYDLKYFFPLQHDWHISTGLNGMSQRNLNKGDEFLVPDYFLFDGGLYMMAQKDWEKWSFAGGLRLDYRYLNSQRKDELQFTNGVASVQYEIFYPFVDKFTNFSGSAGAGYNINKNTELKFNVSSGFRTPNIAELAANGVHEGTIRYEFGNVNLVPEKSYQADLGLSWSQEHILVSASLFDNFITDFIYIRKITGADSVPVANNSQHYAAFIYNQGNANLYGGELSVDYHPHPFDWLHLQNTISYVRGKLLTSIEGTNNLPGMPPLRWIVDLRAQKKALGSRLRNVYAKIGLDNNFAQKQVFTAYATETPATGYTLLDAGIGADITDKKHHTLCTATISALNVTDVAYQNALSRLRYAPENYTTGRMGIYNMGRNFSFILSIPIDVR